MGTWFIQCQRWHFPCFLWQFFFCAFHEMKLFLFGSFSFHAFHVIIYVLNPSQRQIKLIISSLFSFLGFQWSLFVPEVHDFGLQIICKHKKIRCKLIKIIEFGERILNKQYQICTFLNCKITTTYPKIILKKHKILFMHYIIFLLLLLLLL